MKRFSVSAASAASSATCLLIAITLSPRAALAQAPADAATPATSPEVPRVSGERFTVESAVLRMRRSHPLLASSRAVAQSAASTANAVGLWQNPLLSVQYQAGVRNSSYDKVGAGQATLTQWIEVAGVPGARRRAAEYEATAAKLDVDALAHDLAYDVEEACIALSAAAARKQIAEETAEDLERADRIVRARVAAGAAPRYDGSRIAVALADARAAVIDADADVLRARGQLAVAVGPEAATLTGTPQIDLDAAPSVPAVGPLLETAKTGRPDIVAARRRAASATGQIDVVRRNVFSGVGVTVGAGFGQGPGQVDVLVGLMIPLPVIDRGQSLLPAARSRAEAADAYATAVTLATSQRVAAAHAEAMRRREAFERYREASRAVSANMKTEAEAGYREARLSVLELVDAYQSVRDARLRLLGLVASARQAEVGLRRAVGTSP